MTFYLDYHVGSSFPCFCTSPQMVSSQYSARMIQLPSHSDYATPPIKSSPSLSEHKPNSCQRFGMPMRSAPANEHFCFSSSVTELCSNHTGSLQSSSSGPLHSLFPVLWWIPIDDPRTLIFQVFTYMPSFSEDLPSYLKNPTLPLLPPPWPSLSWFSLFIFLHSICQPLITIYFACFCGSLSILT